MSVNKRMHFSNCFQLVAKFYMLKGGATSECTRLNNLDAHQLDTFSELQQTNAYFSIIYLRLLNVLAGMISTDLWILARLTCWGMYTT